MAAETVKVNAVIETVVFAMIAAFLGLRLYSVLGKRTGHEPSMSNPLEAPKPKPISVPELQPEARIAEPADDGLMNESTRAGLRRISGVDQRFHPAEFLEGARSAYEIILEAFWKGDIDGLKPYVAEDVAVFFAEADQARIDSGHVYENRLVRIESSRITRADVVDGLCRIVVEFEADIAAVTRDKDGQVIAGSLTDAVSTKDIWTFERKSNAVEPGWTLIDTDDNND